MVTFQSLLNTLYEIQGACDPNHPAKSMAERMQEIFDLASEQLAAAGFEPD
jgi:hypothetical protein